MIGVLALSVPAVTVASGGGGSAGDQQYTDPFAGTSTPTSATHTTTSAPTTPAAPATTAAPATSPPVQPTTTIDSDPTATMASTSANQLPYTGYDGWLAATFGFVMVAGGLILRRRTARS